MYLLRCVTGLVSSPNIRRTRQDVFCIRLIGQDVSRMRSRRVLVLRLGVWGWELTPNPCAASASVRKRSQAFASVRGVFASVRSVSANVRGQKSSRNAELSSLLDSRGVVASQKCQQSQGSGGPGRETQKCCDFWACVGPSRLKSVNSHRDRRGRGREAQNRDFWTRVVFSHLKSVNSLKDWGRPGRETQNCRHFWTRVAFSRLKSVNSLRDRGGRGCETQNCRHFWTRAVQERGERREERGEKRDVRREGRRERREERGEKRGESESRGERMALDLSFLSDVARGVHIIFTRYVSRVCIRVRGSYQAFAMGTWREQAVHLRKVTNCQTTLARLALVGFQQTFPGSVRASGFL